MAHDCAEVMSRCLYPGSLFFLGGDLHGWWKLRALPTKTGGDFRVSSTKTGGDFVSPPPKLVEIFVPLPPKLVEISCLPHQNWWRFSCLPHQNWWRFSCLPTKTGILTCLTLLMRSPAGVRYCSWPLLPTPSKKRGRPTQPRLS